MRFQTGLAVPTIAALLAGCGGAPSRGPAWPDPAEHRDPEAEDGGESLEPQRPNPIEDGGAEASEGDEDAAVDVEDEDDGGEGDADE